MFFRRLFIVFLRLRLRLRCSRLLVVCSFECLWGKGTDGLLQLLLVLNLITTGALRSVEKLNSITVKNDPLIHLARRAFETCLPSGRHRQEAAQLEQCTLAVAPRMRSPPRRRAPPAHAHLARCISCSCCGSCPSTCSPAYLTAMPATGCRRRRSGRCLAIELIDCVALMNDQRRRMGANAQSIEWAQWNHSKSVTEPANISKLSHCANCHRKQTMIVVTGAVLMSLRVLAIAIAAEDRNNNKDHFTSITLLGVTCVPQRRRVAISLT